MMILASFLAAFLLPVCAGFFAFLAAIVVAAMISRNAEAAYIPEATPGETAEWIASFDAIDVDAEWIALAEAAADVDALIVALESAEVMHRTQATIVDAGTLASGRKLTSYSARIREACDRIRARNEERAYLARLAIEHTLSIASDREWREAYAAPVEFDAEEVRDASLYALTSIACLLGDDSEADRAWRSMQEAASAVRDAFEAADACAHEWRYAGDYRECRACGETQGHTEYTEADETAAA